MIDAFRSAERLMGMSDATWARHANPWSAWSRVSVLPLAAAAIWSRVWIGWWALAAVVAVGVWVWLNPRIFPTRGVSDGWMSRGVRGEKIWMERGGEPALAHHAPVVRALSFATLIGVALLATGLAFLEPTSTVAGLSLAMLSKLWLTDRMVWVLHDAV